MFPRSELLELIQLDINTRVTLDEVLKESLYKVIILREKISMKKNKIIFLVLQHIFLILLQLMLKVA